MQLQLLCATACLSIYYDASPNWLFLDWSGELTLPAVQDACVAVAQCYLTRTYARVLTSKLRVTAIGGGVGTWLGAEFLPYLLVVGVEQLAWVSTPSLGSRNLVQALSKRVPSLALSLFDTAEEAVAWLQQPRPAPVGDYLLPRQPAPPVRLAQGVHAIRQEMQHLQQRAGWRPLTASRA